VARGKLTRRLLQLSAVAAIAGGSVYALWPQPVPADFGRVTRGLLDVVVEEEGKTRIRERYVVSAPLAGRMHRITLKAGDHVYTGQTMLTSIEPGDPALLDTRAVAEAEARIKASAATREQTGPNLEQAKVALEYAQSQHKRVRQQLERGVSTQEDLERVDMLVRSRTEELRAAQFAQQIADFELELARAALPKNIADGNSLAANWNVEIKSPINGRVLRVFTESAGIVTPATQLLELGDPTDLEVEVDVLSSDAVKIEPGARALLVHWGQDEPLEGRVRLVEPAAFTKISALGVEEQRVNVILDFVDPPEKRQSLGDAYRVEARIVVWHGDDVLKVPGSALFRHQERWSVFEVVNGSAVLRPVEIGHRNDLEAEILAGLKENAVVILHPSDKIVDGTRVVAR
jgi:HlyD family secretion protein